MVLQEGYGSLFPCGMSYTECGRLLMQMQSLPSDAFTDPFVDATALRFDSVRRPVVINPQLCDDYIPRRHAPAGIIFQISRCGSTLVSQLLKRATNVMVYSEPLVLNDLLFPGSDKSEDELVSALRVTGILLSQHAAKPYVLKLRSWNSLFARVVRKAFPTSPCVFCIRDPIEVAVSVASRPPTWLRAYSDQPNPFERFVQGLLPSDHTREQYVAAMLVAFCNSVACESGRERLTIVEYASLPGAIFDVVAPFLQLEYSTSAINLARSQALIYSKSLHGQEVLFQPDAKTKQEAACEEIRRAIEIIARPTFESLKRRAIAA